MPPTLGILDREINLFPWFQHTSAVLNTRSVSRLNCKTALERWHCGGLACAEPTN